MAGLHGLTNTLSYGNSTVTSGLPITGFQLAGANAALGMAAGLRLPGAGCVLLVTSLKEEVNFKPDGLGPAVDFFLLLIFVIKTFFP